MKNNNEGIEIHYNRTDEWFALVDNTAEPAMCIDITEQLAMRLVEYHGLLNVTTSEEMTYFTR